VPKTFTDDIAPALPSSLAGPFQIVDPTDAASWIKIDPAGATIAAAGGGRPTRTLLTGYVRQHLSGGSSFIGSVMAARSVNDGVTGGFYTAPIGIPNEMDVAEPADVTILVNPIQDATTNGQVVRLELSYSHVTAAGNITNGVITFDWSVPDDWTVNDPALVLIDNGNGRTFEADTFGAGDYLGLRCLRLGAAAQDTFNKGINLAEMLAFQYTAKGF